MNYFMHGQSFEQRGFYVPILLPAPSGVLHAPPGQNRQHLRVRIFAREQANASGLLSGCTPFRHNKTQFCLKPFCNHPAMTEVAAVKRAFLVAQQDRLVIASQMMQGIPDLKRIQQGELVKILFPVLSVTDTFKPGSGCESAIYSVT